MSNGLRISDSAIMRIVQIVQEAMITLTDATDLLREIRLELDAGDENLLVQTQEYKDLVKKSHDDLLERAEQLRKEVEDRKEIAGWLEGDDNACKTGWSDSDA